MGDFDSSSTGNYFFNKADRCFAGETGVTMKGKTYKDYVIGYKDSFIKKVTQRDNDLFAELSGDHNPLHFNDGVAKSVGFKERISNGFVIESRMAALVLTFGFENSVVLELKKNTTFRKPVYFGDDITATVEVVGWLDSMQASKIKAQCVNQNNETVIETSMLVQILLKKEEK